jgi:hypothetical protein
MNGKSRGYRFGGLAKAKYAVVPKVHDNPPAMTAGRGAKKILKRPRFQQIFFRRGLSVVPQRKLDVTTLDLWPSKFPLTAKAMAAEVTPYCEQSGRR